MYFKALIIRITVTDYETKWLHSENQIEGNDWFIHWQKQKEEKDYLTNAWIFGQLP